MNVRDVPATRRVTGLETCLCDNADGPGEKKERELVSKRCTNRRPENDDFSSTVLESTNLVIKSHLARRFDWETKVARSAILEAIPILRVMG